MGGIDQRATGGVVFGSEPTLREQLREGDSGETGAKLGEQRAAIQEWVHRGGDSAMTVT